MNTFEIPATEHLLRQVQKIEAQIIKWYKENKFSQGDSYSVRVSNKGKWIVSYENDKPMEHGSGESYVLTEEDFISATKKNLNHYTK